MRTKIFLFIISVFFFCNIEAQNFSYFKKAKDYENINDTIACEYLFKSYEYFENKKNNDSLKYVNNSIFSLLKRNFKLDNNYFYNKILKFYLSQNDNRNLGDLFTYYGSLLYLNEYKTSSIRYFKKALKFYQNSDKPSQAFVAKFYLAKMSNYDEAKKIYNNLLILIEDYKSEMDIQGYNFSKANINFKIAEILFNTNNLKESSVKLEEILNFILENNVTIKNDLLLQIYLLKLKINYKTKDRLDINSINNYISEYKELRESQNISPKENILISNIKGLLSLNNGNSQKGVSEIKNAIKIAQQNNLDKELENSIHILINIYEKSNDFKNIIYYQNMLIKDQSRFIKMDKERQVLELELTYNTSNIEKENVILEKDILLAKKDISIEKIKTKNLLIIFLILTLIVMVTFYYLKKIKKANKIIIEQNYTIKKQLLTIQNSYENEIKIKKSLLKSNKAIKKTFAIISHDLKDPFNAILGFSEHLKENYDSTNPQDVKKYIDYIYNAANKNYQFTKQLLTWSLKQQQGFDVNLEQINLYELVNTSINNCVALANTKKAMIKNNIKKDLFCKLDKNIILNVVYNLLTNALKYSNNEVTITINATTKNKLLQISIIDTGFGINENHLSKLNDSITHKNFNFIENNNYTTGYGLIYSKELIKLHNGNLYFESIEGEGTTVTIQIKLNHEEKNNNEISNFQYN